MAEATRKLAQWRLISSEFQFDIVHCAGVGQLAADALSRLRTNGEVIFLLDDELSILTSPKEIFPCRPRTNIADPECIRERKGLFAPFIPDICVIANITDSEKAEIQT